MTSKDDVRKKIDLLFDLYDTDDSDDLSPIELNYGFAGLLETLVNTIALIFM